MRLLDRDLKAKNCVMLEKFEYVYFVKSNRELIKQIVFE